MLHIMGEIIPNKLLNIKRETISREKTLSEILCFILWEKLFQTNCLILREKPFQEKKHYQRYYASYYGRNYSKQIA